MSDSTTNERAGARIETIMGPGNKYGLACGAQAKLLELLRTFTNDEARTQIGHALGSLHRAGALEGVWQPMGEAPGAPSEGRGPFKDGDAVRFTCCGSEYAASVKGAQYVCDGKAVVDLRAVERTFWDDARAVMGIATEGDGVLTRVDVENVRPREGG